jgi:hypothetical protein
MTTSNSKKNDGPNEEGTPVNEKSSTKNTAKKVSQKKA